MFQSTHTHTHSTQHTVEGICFYSLKIKDTEILSHAQFRPGKELFNEKKLPLPGRPGSGSEKEMVFDEVAQAVS